MRYRKFGSSDIQVSEIGLGCEYLEGKDSEIVKRVINAALDGGINILDCFMSEPNVRTNIGMALAGRREQVMIQGHLRSVWKNGQYGRTLKVSEVETFFDDLLCRLQTTYIDFGMIHMVDNEGEFDQIFYGDIMDYAMRLKEKGVIRKLGVSSHNSSVALKAVKSGLVDCLMLSINPAYDLVRSEKPLLRPTDQDVYNNAVNGMEPVRAQLYQECENRGIAITSMKTLCAGLLLNENTSPFRKAMTPYQCFRYALSRPGVSSVMIGMQTEQEVAYALQYENATAEQTDYSEVFRLAPNFNVKGTCVYCNHCLPCPSHIDIAQVNKYLDFVTAGGVSDTVQAHYDSLDHKASECIACGACERSCPFQVSVIRRMKDAVSYFEKQNQE